MIDRYKIKEINDIFQEKNRYKTFLKIELANLEALVSLNVIPQDTYLKIKQKAKINLNRIHEIEQSTKHDVIAFTRSVDELLGEEKKYFHYGLTSTDVVDSALSIMYFDATKILLKDLDNLLDILKSKALEYKDLPCIARTHGMHAEISSFGLRFARFFDEIMRNKERLKTATSEMCLIKIEGAVGNFAFVDKEVETLVAKKFKLKTPRIATQVIARDNHANYLNALALIASCFEDVAVEFRNLSRTEIGEVAEAFSSGQKGSSAMPHKKNPISFENICGLARLVRGYASTGYDNIPLYHERDISHSSIERISIPEAIELTTYLTRRLTSTLDKLVVFKDKIKRNIELTNGLIFSQRLLTELIDAGFSREDAYDLIQEQTKLCIDKNQSFKDACLNNQTIVKLVGKETIIKIFSEDFYLKHVDYIYRRVGLI